MGKLVWIESFLPEAVRLELIYRKHCKWPLRQTLGIQNMENPLSVYVTQVYADSESRLCLKTFHSRLVSSFWSRIKWARVFMTLFENLHFEVKWVHFITHKPILIVNRASSAIYDPHGHDACSSFELQIVRFQLSLIFSLVSSSWRHYHFM